MAPEIVFTEDPRGGKWTARFLNPATVEGSILGRPASEKKGTIVTIRETENRSGTWYEWTTPGEHKPNGNRHHFASDLTSAQMQVVRWASRRFRTEAVAR